eukprot:29787-Pelagococcus_subviridis.AAC.1
MAAVNGARTSDGSNSTRFPSHDDDAGSVGASVRTATTISENATARRAPSKSSGSDRTRSKRNTGTTRLRRRRAFSPRRNRPLLSVSRISPDPGAPSVARVSASILPRNARSQYRSSAASRNSLCLPDAYFAATVPRSSPIPNPPVVPDGAPAWRALAFSARYIAAAHDAQSPTLTSRSVTVVFVFVDAVLAPSAPRPSRSRAPARRLNSRVIASASTRGARSAFPFGTSVTRRMAISVVARASKRAEQRHDERGRPRAMRLRHPGKRHPRRALAAVRGAVRRRPGGEVDPRVAAIGDVQLAGARADVSDVVGTPIGTPLLVVRVRVELPGRQRPRVHDVQRERRGGCPRVIRADQRVRDGVRDRHHGVVRAAPPRRLRALRARGRAIDRGVDVARERLRRLRDVEVERRGDGQRVVVVVMIAVASIASIASTTSSSSSSSVVVVVVVERHAQRVRAHVRPERVEVRREVSLAQPHALVPVAVEADELDLHGDRA